ncbi:hypothetical protein QAD02_002870 [Eretmocerus hayati]|uniref:Uncharacterized protein n=1 Tax=Eretmocerus hayati TaxID=131215 RepID=A0ACC2NL36_9HYME|nr:hypothetical protein QAD02_002870 [Eretmocerus hayati]
MVLQHLILYVRGRRLTRLALAQQRQQHVLQQQQMQQQRLRELEMESEREHRELLLIKRSLLKWVLRDISNPWLLEEGQFINTDRFTPHLAKMLVDMLHEDMKPKISTYGAIPSHLRCFIGLRFCAQGPYQVGLSKNYEHLCGQSSVSKIISKFTNALIKYAENFINFPQTRERRIETETRLRDVGACEGTFGLIDRTTVHISRPCTEEESYYNHQHTCHCIICEVVVDGDYRILSLKVLPGGNPDIFFWKNSEVRGTMERTRFHPRIYREEEHYRLLVILTPIPQPRTDSEKDFNDMLTHVRCRVEQTFGQLKGRWRCLNKERMLHYQPRKACKLGVACAVLHNFAKLGGIPIPVQANDDLGNYNYNRNSFSFEAGLQEKQNLVRRCFD